MKPTEFISMLTETIPGKLPVLVTGAPGIGKTALLREACRKVGADLIVSHPAIEDPTDAKGMPWIVDGKATFVPFGQKSQAISAERLTVWLLDDLGQATPAMQAAYMPLIDHVGLSDNVVFIAATNRRKDRAAVGGVLEPVKSRFATIVELEPDLNEWTQWAVVSGIRPEVIAFLRFQPQLLSNFQPTADLVNSPSPRTWEHASQLLCRLEQHKSILHAALTGAVGEGAAVELIGFLDMFAQLPSIDAILIDGNHGKIPTETSTLYAVSAALAARTTVQNFPQGVRYAKRLMSAGYGEFAVLYGRDACKRNPKLTQTQTYVDLVTNADFAGLVS